MSRHTCDTKPSFRKARGIIFSEYEEFFSRPVGSHIDIQPDDLNRWRCAGETRKAWYQAKRRKNGLIRFWNLGARV